MVSFIRKKATNTPKTVSHLERYLYFANIPTRLTGELYTLLLPNIATWRAIFDASYLGCGNARQNISVKDNASGLYSIFLFQTYSISHLNQIEQIDIFFKVPLNGKI